MLMTELMLSLRVSLRMNARLLNPESFLFITSFLAHTPTSSLLISLLLLFGGFALFIELVSDAFVDLFLLATLVFESLVISIFLLLENLLLYAPFFFRKTLMLEISALFLPSPSLVGIIFLSCSPEILHFLAFVILKEMLVVGEMLLVLAEEAMCDTVKCLRVDLVQDVLTIGLFQHVSVVIAVTLGKSQKSDY